MKKITSLVLIFLIVVSCAACGNSAKQTAQNGGDLALVSPVGGKTVDFHTEKQQSFLNGDEMVTALAVGEEELSRPEPVVLSWKDATPSKKYTVKIGEQPDLSDGVSYSSAEKTADGFAVKVYNLKIAATYYWQVTDADGACSEIASFRTADQGPRNLFVDGITNVRDLGGYPTADGKRVKQNLLFRTARLNTSAVPTAVEITEAGRKTMLEELGVRSEIDLRGGSSTENGQLTESPLGKEVTYYFCPMTFTDGDNLAENKEQVCRVFQLLADEKNYPVFFHCSIGTDRTGMIAYLLGAVLGVGELDLFNDYLFSNYGKIGGKRTPAGFMNQSYYKTVALAEGDTLKEQAENTLLDLGVTADEIAALRKILVEE